MDQQSLIWDEHRNFLKMFAASVNPNDPLPVRVSSYNLTEDEIDGEIIHWSLQYLSTRNCPSTLLNPIVRAVIERIKQQCQKSPDVCGYNPEKKYYQPIKLMRSVTAMVDEVCLKALDNAELDLMMPRICLSKLPPKYESYAVKNGRRIMEDRHVVVDDFNGLFAVKAKDSQRTGFYAIFDGHGGLDAAVYSVSHLHYHLSESVYYPDSPAEAIKDAFIRTDEAFIQKNEFRTLKGGTTALCVLHRPEEKWLYVGWVGDTQALLVKNRKVFQTVKPHKADDEAEQKRIARQGGACIMYNGVWRVNGQLAITRAIGDVDYKPYVTSEPEIMSIPLDGDEDFLIMASDGLWDHVKEDDAAIAVYNMAAQKATDTSSCISQYLVDRAKADGSTDNITIIIVFLKDPAIIGKSVADWAQQQVAMETEYATNNDPLYASDQIIGTAGGTLGSEEEEDSLNNLVKSAPSPLGSAVTGDLLVDENNFYCDTNLNGSGVNIVPEVLQSSTGKRPAADNNDEEGDLGPETDVDAGDEIMLSPEEEEESSAAAKEEKQFEPKETDASEESPEDYNPFITHSNEEQFEVRQENILNFASDFSAPISGDLPPMQHNPFDIPVNESEEDAFHVTAHNAEIPHEFSQADDVQTPNTVESMESDYLNQNVDVTDDCETIRNVPELVEQLPEVANDEISLFGKNLDALQAFNEATPQDENFDESHEMPAGMDVVMGEQQQEVSEEVSDVLAETQQSAPDQPQQEHLEDVSCEITSAQKSDSVVAELASDTPATESGAIVESEEESDEEWNYIKGEHQKELKVKESHAISQAIAESQEACSDLINEDALSEREQEQELVDLEKKEDSDDAMASKLNPDAQEFVPSSPVNNSVGGMKENNHHFNILGSDEILAQSPRKGNGQPDNALFDLPDADQFNADILKCPNEMDGVFLPQSPTNYQEINLKEAMHGDEKKDESVEDTSEKSPQSTDDQINDIIKNIPSALTIGDTVPDEKDPMNMSYHQDINDGSFSTDPHDMNSVHLLPSKEELEDASEEDNKDNADVGDEALKAEEDMFQSEPEREFVAESEKPESELEAASVLLDFAQQKPVMADLLVDTVPQGHVDVTDLDSDFTGMVDQAKLSPDAEEFVPNNRVESQGVDLSSLPESEFTGKSQLEEKEMTVEDSPESDHCFLKDSATDLLVTQEAVVQSKVETPPPTPAATNNGMIEISQRLTSPEPQKLMEAMEKLAEPLAEETKPEEKIIEEVSKTEKEEESVLPAVAAVAGLAVAGAAVVAVTATKEEVKKKTAKAVESSKKEEPKAKPRTTKPASAGAKPAATAAPRTSVGTKAAPAAGKVSPVKPPSTLTARPRSSPATTATKSPVTATAKSPLTTARKPLTSPSAAAKSPLATSAAPKTTLASRTSTTRSPLTKPNSATATRTATGVTAPKTSSSTGATSGVRKTTSTTSTVSTTKNLSTKPTVLSARPKVSSTGATTGTSSTTTTVAKTTRTTLSTAKPRVPSATTTTTTRTVSAVKDSKDVASKLAPKTTSRPLSATTKSLAPKPTITSTLRKTAEATSKVSATTTSKNGVKTTTTTTTSTAKRPGSLTSRTTTTTTKKTTTTKVGAAATEKKPVAAVTEIKTIEVMEKLSNGDLLHLEEKVDGVDVKKEVESQKILDNAAQLIIDLKND
ncbi:serine-rich adhesin for platelets-like [Phlebotomus argentipes]|uniref:serine-rich adhesin for platelets-like n=1 Tax=Phlebotomus argentipes TaxID=94469 RepID=UPI0028937FB1|nr:serine-rich adhesin for platelets-like [Phlebotomus argentipes]